VTYALGLLGFLRPGHHVATLAGWSPGVGRLLGGRVMPCGCLAGTYWTCGNEVIEVVDAAAERCAEGHDLNLVVESQCR
jgi:hypothetical protein